MQVSYWDLYTQDYLVFVVLLICKCTFVWSVVLQIIRYWRFDWFFEFSCIHSCLKCLLWLYFAACLKAGVLFCDNCWIRSKLRFFSWPYRFSQINRPCSQTRSFFIKRIGWSLVWLSLTRRVKMKPLTKSTTGFVFYLGSSAFAWSSKKKPIVTLLICEAEYVVITSSVYHTI